MESRSITPTPAARLKALTSCARCGGTLTQRGTDRCIWCSRPLCPTCYLEHGHCGEPEALEVKRRIQEWEEAVKHQRRTVGEWTCIKVGRLLGLHRQTVRKYARRFCLGQQCYLRGGYEWRFSDADVEKMAELVKLVQMRAHSEQWGSLYQPPWPEWLRVAWASAGRKPEA